MIETCYKILKILNFNNQVIFCWDKLCWFLLKDLSVKPTWNSVYIKYSDVKYSKVKVEIHVICTTLKLLIEWIKLFSILTWIKKECTTSTQNLNIKILIISPNYHLFNLGKMEDSGEQKHWQHMWILVITLWVLQRVLRTKWDCELVLTPCFWTTSRGGMWREHIFTSSWIISAFQNLSIRSAGVITPGNDRYP